MPPETTSTSARVLSMNFRVSWKSLTTTAFTTLPSKGPKPQAPSRPVTSCTVRSMRRSGLSEPYFSMASV